MAKFGRKNKNPIGTHIVCVRGQKNPVKIKGRDQFETMDKKVIMDLRKDVELVELTDEKMIQTGQEK